MEAVKNSGIALQYASNELKADREVVLEAIKEDVLSLQYASNKLPNKESIILLSIAYGLDILEIFKKYYFGKTVRE